MRIAVIDSGVPKKTKLNIIEQYRIFVNEDYEKYVLTDRIEDENGHASIVIKILEKYLEKTDEVISIKVLNKNLKGNSIALIKGIQVAVEKGCKIINISLGTTNKKYREKINEVIKYAIQNGVLVVAAHTNKRKETSFPSSFNNVIGIIGTKKKLVSINLDKNNIFMKTKQKICFDKEIVKIEGTSYLAPHITGILSQILKNEEIKDKKNILEEIKKRVCEEKI